MTDSAGAFLSRKERRAITKRLKRGEKAQAMVPCVQDGRHGLLCCTKARLLFAARKGLGYKVWTWPRASIEAVAHEKKRYGTVVIRTRKQRLRFQMTQRGDAQAFLQTLTPQKPRRRPREGLPSRAQRSTRPPVRPKMAPEPEPDALAHRSTADHRARLKRMLDRGIITKREYEWQVESLA